MLLLGDFDHFTSFITPTMRADAMRQFWFMTVWALRCSGDAQRIVGAAGGGTLLGVSSFWIGHLDSFSLKIFQHRPAIIHGFHFASAIRQVTVMAANRTDAVTFFTADPLHRQ